MNVHFPNGASGHYPAPTNHIQGDPTPLDEAVYLPSVTPGYAIAAYKRDWPRGLPEGLRQHLIDMNNVTLQAQVKSEPVDGGMRFTVTGEGTVADSIRRMVSAHAATMNGVDGWRFSAAEVDGGATFTALAPARDLSKLRGLGFIGVMTRGMHHQEHHLMLARGEHPHGG